MLIITLPVPSDLNFFYKEKCTCRKNSVFICNSLILVLFKDLFLTVGIIILLDPMMPKKIEETNLHQNII